MPHVIVKMWPGKSEQQKARLAELITKDITDILQYGEHSVSVAMEEITPEEWADKVYRTDIEPKWNQLYKEPGYTVEADGSFGTRKVRKGTSSK